MTFIKQHPWILYILVIIVYVALSIKYPYLDPKYQRELLLGKGEIPFGSLGFVITIGITYVFIQRKIKT
jgi:hypothetical protein